jgi:hypothetical protein
MEEGHGCALWRRQFAERGVEAFDLIALFKIRLDRFWRGFCCSGPR